MSQKLSDFARLMQEAIAEKKMREQIAIDEAIAEIERNKKISEDNLNSFQKIFGVIETAATTDQLPLDVIAEETDIEELVAEPEQVIENTITKVEPDAIFEYKQPESTSSYLTKDLYEAKLVIPEKPKSIESVIKNLQLEMSGLRNYIDAKVSSIDQQIGWGSGGGAARVADLDDVDVRTTALVDSVTLSYDPIKRKWLPKTLEMLAEDLGPLIGGKLYAPYNRMIDVAGTKTYIGEATPGTAVNQTGWRIKMIEEFPTGDMSIIWANGSETFNLIWDNRLTYTYEVN